MPWPAHLSQANLNTKFAKRKGKAHRRNEASCLFAVQEHDAIYDALLLKSEAHLLVMNSHNPQGVIGPVVLS